MKKTFFKVLLPAIIFGLLAVLTSCMYLFPVHYDTHTVIINLSNSRGRFVNADEAQAYSNYYEIRLYQYQNGEIMKTPILTKVLDGNDLSFTCDTGYYYLEMDAWAEKTGTVVTGRGSTENTESFDDGIKVTPGVFELSYEQRTVAVTVQMHATPEEDYPRWNITWDLNGGEWKQSYEPETSFDWRRMYPLSDMDDSMSPFPRSTNAFCMAGDEPATLVGWYLTDDWKGSPVTSFTQLPLQDVTLYARWITSSGIETDIGSYERVTVTLQDETPSGYYGSEYSQEKCIKAVKNDEEEWEDETFSWYVDGTLYPDTDSVFNFTLTETGLHTVVCVVYSSDGTLLGSGQTSVLYSN